MEVEQALVRRIDLLEFELAERRLTVEKRLDIVVAGLGMMFGEFVPMVTILRDIILHIVHRRTELIQ
ncbi:hypothetical protein [Saliphagus sp. LR7]|uniref:hypothetical protein n=1 Tax=Saliphagus sp. LR7 TaxID=2282654 RepID=UPI0018E532EB|nr:hypothetical protein [Saliphagus sp. LR7]